MCERVESVMCRKRLFAIIGIIILLILLVPVPLYFDDGGTVVYQAITYSVYNYRALWEEDGYYGVLIGTKVRVFSIIVFDNTQFERIGEIP